MQGASLAEVSASLERGAPVNLDAVRLLPSVRAAQQDHLYRIELPRPLDRNQLAKQTYPTVFARFASSLIGRGEPVVLPAQSSQLDFEGELAAVIGKGGHSIARERALDHVAGYSIFDDATLCDYRFRTPQDCRRSRSSASGCRPSVDPIAQ